MVCFGGPKAVGSGELGQDRNSSDLAGSTLQLQIFSHTTQTGATRWALPNRGPLVNDRVD